MNINNYISFFTKTFSFFLFALLLTSCIESNNAFFSIEIQFDAKPETGELYPHFMFLTDEPTNNHNDLFDTTWVINNPPELEGIILNTQGLLMPKTSEIRTKINIGIESLPEYMEKDLLMKIKFCKNPACSGEVEAEIPTLAYAFEHPFYTRQYTYFKTLNIETLPTMPKTTPTTFSKCRIAGCVDATPDQTNFCLDDGLGNPKHYCE